MRNYQKQSKEKTSSARGYFYDLSISPHTVQGVNGTVYRFPSEKKKEMFIKEYNKRINGLGILLNRVYNISNKSIEVDDEMNHFILDDIYNEMKKKF